MKRINTSRLVVVGLAIIALAAAGVGLVPRLLHHDHATSQANAVYYCPMHPTYTSNRPGDCPICNMKLVKREDSTQHTAHSTQQTAKDLESICYLHNCPKAHQGQPCPMTVVAKRGEKVTCPICGTHIAEAAQPAKEKKILYWTDPMIPGYKAEGPGKSPMGMDLVPVYAEDETTAAGPAPEGYAPVLVSPQRQQLIGVRTAPAATRSLSKTIRTVGRIAYDPELYQAQEEYLQALRASRLAGMRENPQLNAQSEQLIDSARIRLRLLGMSDALIEEMAGWEQPDRSLLLTDPERRAWLYATVYEYELPLVSAGQVARVDIPAQPGKVLEGVIRSIDPVLDPMTRSARVRAALTDPEGVLKPEMFVNVSIVIPIGEVLAIPAEAVFNTGTKQIVFVDQGQGLFEPRDVVLGPEADGFVEVKDGISAGETVVTSGNFLIDSESRLKAALEGVTGGGGHQHGGQ